MLGSVSKAGRVLNLFTPEMPEWGVSAVALELGIAKSSAHALMLTLDDIGLVRRLPDGRYRLGWKIIQLNRTLQHSTDLAGPSRSRLQRLADGLRATVHVAGLRGREVVYLDKFRGGGCPDIAESGTGMVMPAYCTALGKVLLASLSPAQADALLTLHGMERRTPRTITSPEALREDLGRARTLGVGYDLEESVPSVCCVAAPVRGRDGIVEAAVSVTVPAAAFHGREDQFRRAARSAARVLSQSCRTPAQLASAG
jgi:DNA-binding IclR family transcriptional regulator